MSGPEDQYGCKPTCNMMALRYCPYIERYECPECALAYTEEEARWALEPAARPQPPRRPASDAVVSVLGGLLWTLVIIGAIWLFWYHVLGGVLHGAKGGQDRRPGRVEWGLGE